jgi:ankyrin repeat protein
MAYKELVKSLIKAGAMVNAPDQEKFTALHMASSVGTPDIVEMLLEANANPNALSQVNALMNLFVGLFLKFFSSFRIFTLL